MADDGRKYDGHTFVFGMDADTEPTVLSSSVAARAVNRVFRGGRNRTRPPFVHKQFVFDEDNAQYETIVRFGNIQGAFAYRRKKPGRADGIVAAIAGRIFHFTIVNDKLHVKFVADGNDPKLLHTWFCQAEEWLYSQNGKEEALFWDGQYPSTARRSLGTAGQEMPIGTIMCYIHGRIFVSNAFDQVAASDIMYGGGFTNSLNVQRFTENKYWAEGGYFGLPMDLGQITGMIAVGRQNRGNLRGQGELLITSIDGGQVIEAGTLRALWETEQVQSIAFTGRGATSPWSLINVNNDVFFRSDDGLSSYKMTQNELQTSLSLTKISREVNNWFDQDTPDLLQYTSSIYFDNRVLTTVSPFLESPNDESYGSHRVFRGIISLDLDKRGKVPGDSDFNYDGLWTGIRPVVLVRGRFGSVQRAFALSHDTDGENRFYEILRKGIYDEAESKPVKTHWFYHTKRFDWSAAGASSQFDVKKIIGGEVWISDIHEPIKIGAQYRADYNPCWGDMLPEMTFGSKPSGWKFSQPRYKRMKFNTPKETCQKGLPYPSTHGAVHQVKIYGQGAVQIDRMRIDMKVNDANAPIGSCNDGANNSEISLDCQLEDDYSYSIIEQASIVNDNG